MTTLKKIVGDPVLWRRLRDEHIGLLLAWTDDNGRSYAYAITPALPDDNSAIWDREFDDRPRLMQDGATMEEALLKLFDDPRRKYQPSLSRSLAALSVEIVSLTGVIGRG